jgi:hypothetical protein
MDTSNGGLSMILLKGFYFVVLAPRWYFFYSVTLRTDRKVARTSSLKS